MATVNAILTTVADQTASDTSTNFSDLSPQTPSSLQGSPVVYISNVTAAPGAVNFSYLVLQYYRTSASSANLLATISGDSSIPASNMCTSFSTPPTVSATATTSISGSKINVQLAATANFSQCKEDVYTITTL